MPIVPDTKDWTWVLDRRCPECGFDAGEFPRERVSDLIRTNAAAWQQVLDPTGAGTADRSGAARVDRLRQRPSDDRWSVLEYACHVRDVFALYDHRLGLMLIEDDPQYPNWDQDEAAVEERYNEQDPVAVGRDLASAAESLAQHFAGVTGDQWQRTGTRSDGAHFTVESFARYMVHDPIHHLHDVDVNFRRLEQGPAS